MGAAEFVGEAYYWGKGVAIDHQRAMAAYKTGAERGDAACQHQVGWMYYNGHGVDVNHKQAREWWEKAAAQDDPEATSQLGLLYHAGDGVPSSFRRARELIQRAIELGNFQSVMDMQGLNSDIQLVGFKLFSDYLVQVLVAALSTCSCSYRC